MEPTGNDRDFRRDPVALQPRKMSELTFADTDVRIKNAPV